MQVELHAQFIPDSELLLVVLEGADDAALFARCNVLPYEIPEKLDLEELHFTDFTLSYYNDGFTLCTWGKGIDLQNSVYMELISKYAFANHSKWLKIRTTI